MGRGEDEVARAVHDSPFALGVTAPQDENQAFALGRQAGYDGIGEAFPTAPLVRTRLMGPHGQRGVEQEHTLLGPAPQTAALWCWATEVGTDFLEDILQRRRMRHAVGHGEAQPFGLARLMIGVLPDDDHAHALEGAQVERIEYLRARRIARASSVLGTHKFRQRLKIVGIKLRLQARGPGRVYLYLHNQSQKE